MVSWQIHILLVMVNYLITSVTTFLILHQSKNIKCGLLSSQKYALPRMKTSLGQLYVKYIGAVATSVCVALNVRFTTNGMCSKNNTHIYVARTSNNRVISIVACCHSVKPCAHVARTFRLQRYQNLVSFQKIQSLALFIWKTISKNVLLSCQNSC